MSQITDIAYTSYTILHYTVDTIYTIDNIHGKMERIKKYISASVRIEFVLGTYS